MRDCRGQALTETAIVVVLLVLLSLGIIEFGRAFMVLNMVTHAARDGARAAAVVPTASRDANGIINSTAQTAIKDQVKNEMKAVLGSAVDTICPDCVTISQPDPTTTGNIPVVRISIDMDVPYIFNLVGAGTFKADRQVTFRDEGR